MLEKISKKQEKVQEKIQKQQELNDKDCRELTDEELEQVTGGMVGLVHYRGPGPLEPGPVG